jgi:hypothetical protein
MTSECPRHATAAGPSSPKLVEQLKNIDVEVMMNESINAV